MLKKLIKELNTLSSSVKDVSESQSKASGNFTELYNAIIKAEEGIGSTNQEIIRAYYSFGKELKDRFTAYKSMHVEDVGPEKIKR